MYENNSTKLFRRTYTCYEYDWMFFDKVGVVDQVN